MKENYREYKYTITNNFADLGPDYNFSGELMDILDEYGHKVFNEGKNAELIPELVSLIVKYPYAAVLKNYLSMAYFNSGQVDKAVEVNDWILKEHPEYLYGRVNRAFEFLNSGRIDEIPALLANLTDIQDLYPKRSIFHIQEVISFHKIAACYFASTGDFDEAINRANLLEELDKQGDDYNYVANYINNARIKSAHPIYSSKGTTNTGK